MTTKALFVHGMGRSPLSGWPMLARLRAGGIATETFGYSAALQTFEAIAARLAKRISIWAIDGDCIVIGHSLGGVLLRRALADLPGNVPRPRHAYLLASPQHPARLAVRLGEQRLYRALTGDCGQLLGSAPRMAAIPALTVPATAIIGTRGLRGGPFGGEPNDGIVSASEVRATWLGRVIELPQVHTWLPASAAVARIILADQASDAS